MQDIGAIMGNIKPDMLEAKVRWASFGGLWTLAFGITSGLLPGPAVGSLCLHVSC